MNEFRLYDNAYCNESRGENANHTHDVVSNVVNVSTFFILHSAAASFPVVFNGNVPNLTCRSAVQCDQIILAQHSCILLCPSYFAQSYLLKNSVRKIRQTLSDSIITRKRTNYQWKIKTQPEFNFAFIVYLTIPLEVERSPPPARPRASAHFWRQPLSSD